MIDDILAKMTLEETVSLLSGADFWTTAGIERHGVPKIKMTDGPNGARGAGSLTGGTATACFPAAVCLGASWNEPMIAEMGRALARQVRSKGASVVLAPTVNIHRSGLNGRGFECFSEDPLLTGALAVAYIRGLQSEGVAATIKHFVGNESEIDRQTMSSDIDERTLREIYLLPFEKAVREAGVMAIMSSYNRLNGVHTSEHPWLLTEVLRDEWGFEGVVMSDWFGSHSTIASVNAGLDLEMPGPTRDRGEALVRAVASGAVDERTVRASARRVLSLIEKVGAFVAPPDLHETVLDEREDRELIRKLGAEAAVLLKNDGILPLSKAGDGAIALIGPNAAVPRLTGGGSAQITSLYAISPLQGIRDAVPASRDVLHAEGCENNRLVALLQDEIRVEYFMGRACDGEPVLVETAHRSDFLWFDMPSSMLDPTDFAVRLTANFMPTVSGAYRFGLANAGLAKLHVDDRLVVNGHDGWVRGSNYFGTANEELRSECRLEAGRTYRIRIDYISPDYKLDGVNLAGVRFGVEKVQGDELFDRAVETARRASVALLFVGRNEEWDTEGLDLPDLRLPGRQEELIGAVAAVNPNTVVVLQTGGPVEMPWLGKVKAVLQMGYPGQELGHAVADVLFGDAEPGGRLPQTYPKRLADNAAITGDASVYPGRDLHVRYEEGVFVGYRHHDAHGIEPLFPFGFGLGYTSFEWSEPGSSARDMTPDGIEISVDVTNTGRRQGSEVVQLYLRALETRIERPEKELRAFAKLQLAAGATGTARLRIRPRDLAYFDVERKSFRADAGTYEVLLAASAADIRGRIAIRLPQDWQETDSPAR